MTLIGLVSCALPLFLVGFILGHAQARKGIVETARRLGAFHVGAAVFRVVEKERERSQSSYPGAPPNPHRQAAEPSAPDETAQGKV